MAPGRRRWTTVAASAAVLAAASTTAWAAVSTGDAPQTSATGLAAANTRQAAATPQATATAAPTLTPSVTSASATASASPSGSPLVATPAAPSSASVPGEGSRPAVPANRAPVSARDRASSADGEKNSTAKQATSVESAKVATRSKARVIASGRCGASFYDEPQMTASGERFNPSAMTAAHKSLPLGSKVRVINPSNGKDIVVRINDRGPYTGGRCLDLSEAAFSAIGNTGSGVMTVKYQVLAR
ncbi:septal ring lytic transglycosylase RlpA family protein [Nonomuraea sp. NPDC003804]|uniref:septal ring lytic transglycosylase RlpA family protein n=1 Tax=Nonomuraea sp. NPDC003804 TaxID=3154547 RepID=UPI0033A80D2A